MDKLFHKCRLCLKLGDFCSIFEQDNSLKLSEMVMSFANIQIFEGDGLTDRVCTSCIENLSTAYLFKLQCERINTLLRKCPDIQIDQPDGIHFSNFLDKDFHVHNESLESSVEGENVINSANDINHTETHNSCNSDVSDETDSDVDSVKCVYCSEAYSNLGGHSCNVTCTIEHNQLQHSSSSETLVASDTSSAVPVASPPVSITPDTVNVPCVLCDETFTYYDAYLAHFNKCTTNVKLHHFVCPICHDIHTDKLTYLEHLKIVHFKTASLCIDSGEDCVDAAPIIEKTRRPKAVRRQIGWSIEDIYQEIDCKVVDEKPVSTSSPLKTFLSKLGNDSFSSQSTPKKVSFRNFIESSKAKTIQPVRNYIQSYRLKKKINNYSPIKDKVQVAGKIKASLPEIMSDSDYNSPSGTSEESWRLKQNLICACDKKVFMLSEYIHDRDRIVSMINELGGVVAENTKMEMLATHFISVLPNDTFTGMMVCALTTGKWLLHISFIFDSFRCKKFLSGKPTLPWFGNFEISTPKALKWNESIYEWMKHPKILEIDNTSLEVAKAAVYWHLDLQALSAKYPFEGKQIVLIMKKKYRQYYQMIFKTLKAKPVTYDPRTPGSCCSADYCFVDMKVIERVKLRFFARHNVPVFPYQYILVYLLNRGNTKDEYKYLIQDCKKINSGDSVDFLNNTY